VDVVGNASSVLGDTVMQIHAAERAASEGLSLGASQGAVPWSWPPASFGTCAGGAVQTATEALQQCSMQCAAAVDGELMGLSWEERDHADRALRPLENALSATDQDDDVFEEGMFEGVPDEHLEEIRVVACTQICQAGSGDPKEVDMGLLCAKCVESMAQVCATALREALQRASTLSQCTNRDAAALGWYIDSAICTVAQVATVGMSALADSRPESARARMDEARQRIMLDSDEARGILNTARLNVAHICKAAHLGILDAALASMKR